MFVVAYTIYHYFYNSKLYKGFIENICMHKIKLCLNPFTPRSHLQFSVLSTINSYDVSLENLVLHQ